MSEIKDFYSNARLSDDKKAELKSMLKAKYPQYADEDNGRTEVFKMENRNIEINRGQVKVRNKWMTGGAAVAAAAVLLTMGAGAVRYFDRHQMPVASQGTVDDVTTDDVFDKSEQKEDIESSPRTVSVDMDTEHFSQLLDEAVSSAAKAARDNGERLELNGDKMSCETIEEARRITIDPKDGVMSDIEFAAYIDKYAMEKGVDLTEYDFCDMDVSVDGDEVRLSSVAYFGKRMKMPDLDGVQLTKAQSDWDDKLRFEIVSEYSADHPEGAIFYQNVKPGEYIKREQIVTVMVSKGVPDDATFEMPELIGKDMVQVSADWNEKLTFTVISEYDADHEAGVILDQSIKRGEQVKPGENITVKVSKGSKPENVKVPNVIGLNRKDAEQLIKDSGLNAVIERVPNSSENETVIDQSIDPDTAVEEGTEVTIYVSADDADAIDMTLCVPMPEGLSGAYSVDVYKDGVIAYKQSVSDGTEVAGDSIYINIKGSGTETLTINITSNDTGKSVDYATFNVDYDKKTADLAGALDTDGLIALNK